MKIKIKNSLLWKWNSEHSCPQLGNAILAIQKLGSDRYKYPDAGTVRYRLMRTETVLVSAFKEIEKMRAQFQTEAIEKQAKSEVKNDTLSGEPLAEYLKAVNGLLEVEDEHEVRPVKWSQLDVKTNNITNDVLIPLIDTVIEDDMKDA